MRTRLSPVLVTIVLALGLSACTGGGEETEESTDPAVLQERLSAARQVIDTAETIEISLSTNELPDGVSGLLSAEGTGNHDPSFEGEVTVVTGGSSLAADVVAVDGEVYAKTSFAPVFLSIDPASLRAPDPATLLGTENGISTILEETDDLADEGRSRDGEAVLTTISGTLPGSVVKEIIPSAEDGATFDVQYRLDDDDELQDATIAGPFYPGGRDVTYRVRLDTSDEPVTIEAPARTGGA